MSNVLSPKLKAQWKKYGHNGFNLVLDGKILGSTNYGLMRESGYVGRTSIGDNKEGFGSHADAQKWVVDRLLEFAQTLNNSLAGTK